MKIGFIGAGNMGGAILRGAINKKYFSPNEVLIRDANLDVSLALGMQTGVRIASSNIEVAQSCDMILLCVKPVFMGDVIRQIRPYLQGKALVSIAAGWTSQMLREATGENVQVLRVMPNTPALVGQGMTALCLEHTFTQEAYQFAKGLFQAVGQVCEIPERLMDGFIAVSGSSPAYVFMLIEAMADAAVKEGIFRKDAYRMAAQAVLGSAQMVLDTNRHPGELKDMVCSPAGTTIEAVAALEANGFRAAVMDAMAACAEKSREMSK